MMNLDSVTNENNKKHNEKSPYVPDRPYRVLIIGGSGSRKTNTLLNLINKKNDIDKIYLYARDLDKPKYKILIKKCKDAGIKHLNYPNSFIECSNTMDDVYENIDDYNSSRKRKILIFFDDIKSKYNNNKFRISAPTWNDTFDLPDGSYSVSDIQDYFEFIIQKHETLTENPPIQIYPNKIKNRIVFKIKTGHELELLTPETMR